MKLEKIKAVLMAGIDNAEALLKFDPTDNLAAILEQDITDTEECMRDLEIEEDIWK